MKYTRLINYIFKPIIAEFPFFSAMMILIGYRAIYMLLMHPTMFLFDWTQYPRLRIIGISIVFAYIFVLIVYWIKSCLVKYFLYVVAIFLFSINVFLMLAFNSSIFYSSLIRLFETNIKEAESFVSTFVFSVSGLYTVMIAILLLITCCYWDKCRFIFESRYKRLSTTMRLYIETAFILILLGGAYSFHIYYDLFKCKNVDEIDNWSYRINMLFIDQISNSIYSIYSLYLVGNNLAFAELSTQRACNGSSKLMWSDDSTNIIFVIGESHIKKHSSIYGYSLQTNPCLQREQEKGNLFIFNNVISPYIYTSEAMRNILSTNSLGDGEQWYDYPFFPALFHQAGYHVWFWDNQYVQATGMPFDFTLNAYVHSPVISKVSYDEVRGYISQIDGEMLDDFEKTWLSNTNKSKNNFIILHLQGQHFSPDKHYPLTPEFMHFTSDSIQREEAWMTDDIKEVIAHYDNCTLYNDLVLSRIMNIFEEESSVIVYLSDHGDVVYDLGDYRGRRENDLRSDGIHFLLDVPFVIWCSNKYMTKHPDIIRSIQSSVDKPMMTDNICHLIFDLGGVVSQYYYPQRNILSPDYKCPPRIVQTGIDYDTGKSICRTLQIGL